MEMSSPGGGIKIVSGRKIGLVSLDFVAGKKDKMTQRLNFLIQRGLCIFAELKVICFLAKFVGKF